MEELEADDDDLTLASVGYVDQTVDRECRVGPPKKDTLQEERLEEHEEESFRDDGGQQHVMGRTSTPLELEDIRSSPSPHRHSLSEEGAVAGEKMEGRERSQSPKTEESHLQSMHRRKSLVPFPKAAPPTPPQSGADASPDIREEERGREERERGEREREDSVNEINVIKEDRGEREREEEERQRNMNETEDREESAGAAGEEEGAHVPSVQEGGEEEGALVPSVQQGGEEEGALVPSVQKGGEEEQRALVPSVQEGGEEEGALVPSQDGGDELDMERAIVKIQVLARGNSDRKVVAVQMQIAKSEPYVWPGGDTQNQQQEGGGALKEVQEGGGSEGEERGGSEHEGGAEADGGMVELQAGGEGMQVAHAEAEGEEGKGGVSAQLVREETCQAGGQDGRAGSGLESRGGEGGERGQIGPDEMRHVREVENLLVNEGWEGPQERSSEQYMHMGPEEMRRVREVEDALVSEGWEAPQRSVLKKDIAGGEAYTRFMEAGRELDKSMEELRAKQQQASDQFHVEPLLVPPKVLHLLDKTEADASLLDAISDEDRQKRAAEHTKLKEQLREATQRAGIVYADAPANKEEGCNMTVYCGTWNLGGIPCPQTTLTPWICPGEYDIYAIAAQEVEAKPGPSTARSRPKWEARIRSVIGEGYHLVGMHCLGTTHIMVFVRDSIVSRVCDVHSAHVITGIGNAVANKAGLGVCFDIGKTSFLFVTAHFAAHTEHVAARCDDYNRIEQGLCRLMCPAVAARGVPVGDAREQRESLVKGGVQGWSVSVLFDRVFWLGDFNYRLDMTREAVDSAIKLGRVEDLFEFDQLQREMKKGTVFRGFEEPPLMFPPTYKFAKWTDTYDPSKKKRVPAWTDRVLYRTPPGHGWAIRPEIYTSIGDIRASDHKPVMCVFNVYVPEGLPESDPAKMRHATNEGSPACIIL